MKRRRLVVVILVMAVAMKFAFRRSGFVSPAAPDAQHEPASVPTVPGTTLSSDSLPLNGNAADEPATGAVTDPPTADESARETLHSRYLAALPENLQARAATHVFASGPRAMAAELLLDGVRVEGTDVRFLPRTPVNELPQPILPPAITRKGSPQAFPERDLTAEAEREIRDILASSSLEIEKLEFVEKTWQPVQDALIPCLRYRVDTREKSGRAGEKENWCLDARTAKVVSRNARVRH